jgi:hypothetical protein
MAPADASGDPRVIGGCGDEKGASVTVKPVRKWLGRTTTTLPVRLAAGGKFQSAEVDTDDEFQFRFAEPGQSKYPPNTDDVSIILQP